MGSNSTLIIEGVIAALDLVTRLAQARGFAEDELDDYISLREQLRRSLMSEVLASVESEEDPDDDEDEDDES
jgi:hypothetical protein